jgi:hypothetical protein
MRKVNAITLAGLMTGLHLLLVVAFTYVPYTIFFEVFVYIIAPLVSTVYTLKSDNKYLLIFFAATLLAGLLFNPIVTVTYILPILVIGISFGFVIKIGLNELRIIYAMTIIYVLIFGLTILTIRLLYGVALDQILIMAFNLSNNPYLGYLLLIGYGFLQSLVLTLILKPEVKKFGYVIPPFKQIKLFDLVFFLIILIVASFSPGLGDLPFLFSILALFFSLPIILFGYLHNRLRTKTLVFSFSLSFLFIFLPLLGLLPTERYPLALIGLFIPLLVLGTKRFIQLHYVSKR